MTPELETLLEDMQEQAEIAEISGDGKLFQLLDIAAYELRILMNRKTITGNDNNEKT